MPHRMSTHTPEPEEIAAQDDVRAVHALQPYLQRFLQIRTSVAEGLYITDHPEQLAAVQRALPPTQTPLDIAVIPMPLELLYTRAQMGQARNLPARFVADPASLWVLLERGERLVVIHAQIGEPTAQGPAVSTYVTDAQETAHARLVRERGSFLTTHLRTGCPDPHAWAMFETHDELHRDIVGHYTQVNAYLRSLGATSPDGTPVEARPPQGPNLDTLVFAAGRWERFRVTALRTDSMPADHSAKCIAAPARPRLPPAPAPTPPAPGLAADVIELEPTRNELN